MRSLALVVVALAGLLAFEGCGSDSPSSKKTTPATCTSSTFCPMVGTAMGCCINSSCGMMVQGGCIPMGGKADAGVR